MSKISESQGVVYTPEYWADWAVQEYRIHRKWIEGARILDPGCGRGALLEAVIRNALAEGFTPSDKDLTRLTGVDTDTEALDIFAGRLERLYKLALPETSLRNDDFLLGGSGIEADIILANPPWLTFGDLDETRKELYKPVFRSSGLTPDPRELLLGGSRIDLAALFVLTSLNRNLVSGGEGYFFLPMSLFRSEGAHKAFRQLPLTGGRSGALSEIRELDGGAPFPGAGTRYGFACYHLGRRQTWPVPWMRAGNNGEWQVLEAHPVEDEGSPLLPVSPGEELPEVPNIAVPEGCRPRQGANPCGAAEAFIIEETGDPDGETVAVVNRKGLQGRLPVKLLYPLMTAESFQDQSDSDKPRRWIFLPYGEDGKVLSLQKINQYPDAAEWLNRHRKKLENRRGRLIAGWKEKGIWWSMMGVAPYAFSPWKVAWEAYGREEFRPRLFGKEDKAVWQGNQALHAYLPFYDLMEAERVLSAISKPEIGEYLRSLGGAGTKLWAQPGRIMRLLK